VMSATAWITRSSSGASPSPAADGAGESAAIRRDSRSGAGTSAWRRSP
jgi:hypothetical protein